MREIGILTTSRADFGIYLPVLEELRADPEAEVRIVAGGSHIDERFGRTETEIAEAGFEVFGRAPSIGEDIPESLALGISSMREVLRDWRPDIMLVLGDRYEMLAGALGTVGFQLPLAHIHGGEVTEGALDDAFRHMLTKLSHLHFAVTEDAEWRLLQLGEEDWRILRSGSPALDRLRAMPDVELDLPERFLLVTYHPVTLESGDEEQQARELASALEEQALPVVVTAPNADPGREVVDRVMRDLCERQPGSRYEVSLGPERYVTLLRRAAVMVGNSSSGLIEAPSLELPVVNVGSRQDGRPRAANVIDAANDRASVAGALRRALDPAFRESLRGMTSPYGDGTAARKIVERLLTVPLDARLLRKRFVDR